MGADFIYAIARWPYSEGGEAIHASPELASAVKRRFRKAADTVREDSLDEDLPALWTLCGALIEDFPTTWREVLTESLNDDFFQPVFSESELPRDVATGSIGGVSFVISGDMSWGEAPEGCDMIWALDWLGINDEPYIADELKKQEA